MQASDYCAFDDNTCVFSDTCSSKFIMPSARPRRRYSGATVMAVTCPCQFLPVPSAFPITVNGFARRLARKKAYMLDSSSSSSFTVTHKAIARRHLNTKQIRPSCQVLKIKRNIVLVLLLLLLQRTVSQDKSLRLRFQLYVPFLSKRPSFWFLTVSVPFISKTHLTRSQHTHYWIQIDRLPWIVAVSSL